MCVPVALHTAHREASLRAVSLLFGGVGSLLPPVDTPLGSLAGGRACVLNDILPQVMNTIRSFPSLSSHLTTLELEVFAHVYACASERV